MKIRVLLAATFILLCAIASPQASAAPQLSGPGGIHHPLSTRNAEAQRLFNEGLFYIFAFNHDEAIRSFEKAAQADPDLAMAYWGVALALGPNINLPADPPRQKRAYDAISKALSLSAKLPDQEVAYIKALATRYTGKPDEDLRKLAENYSAAMKALSRKYPDDQDAATLYAESLMDLRPWQLWSADGRPAEGTLEIVSVLESVLRRNPSHIGANHYYIHAVEASPHPEWALPSAERLKAMQLPAGHLVHMPAHVFMRTGDYASAAESNLAGARTDEEFIKKSGSGGVYPKLYYNHNLHFLAVSRGLEGRYGDAMAAAEQLARNVSADVKETPALEFYLATPPLVQVWFHKWQEILKQPQPDPQLQITGMVWHFARGLAFAATGDARRARKERDAFVQSMQKLPADAAIDLNSAANVAKVAQLYLEGRIAMEEEDLDAAAALLRKGVAAEDALQYTEPPSWYLPVREALGGVLLRKRDYRAAEETFREDLVKYPRSGRALFGLYKSLEGQKRKYEAELVQREYEKAWSNADSKLAVNSF